MTFGVTSSNVTWPVTSWPLMWHDLFFEVDYLSSQIWIDNIMSCCYHFVCVDELRNQIILNLYIYSEYFI